jgi:MFS family permease
MFAVVGFTLICHSMASVAWFEIGSLFCGVSTTANFLIFGRAVAGIGAAGSQFTSEPDLFPFTLLTLRGKFLSAYWLLSAR